MSNERNKQVWRENIIEKYGSLEAYAKVRQERGIGFQKGHTPANKIQDDLTDLDISPSKKSRLRRLNNEKQD